MPVLQLPFCGEKNYADTHARVYVFIFPLSDLRRKKKKMKWYQEIEEERRNYRK